MELLIDQQADAVHGIKHTLGSHWPIRTACPTCVCIKSKDLSQRGFVLLNLVNTLKCTALINFDVILNCLILLVIQGESL